MARNGSLIERASERAGQGEGGGGAGGFIRKVNPNGGPSLPGR